MNGVKKTVLGCALAATAAAGASTRPPPLEAQVIRCYDVVCTEDSKGVLRCVEKPTTCPPET